ncbi:MAG: helix-turn-helix domain-containing protein [Chloroflexi bacterium]|nr:helix-turn-helix domain-containing protein [Chloroflexota bacterium]
MKSASSASAPDLITLRQASALLGVHPSTVRAWANQGKLKAVRTAGGHRRFSAKEVHALAGGHELAEQHHDDAQLIMHSALGRARMAVGDGNLTAQGWYRLYDERTREQHREMGRRLLGLMMHYLNAQGDDTQTTRILREARKLGSAYGAIATQQGLALSDAMRAFLFFRDFLLESVIQMREVVGASANSLATYRLINQFANEVLIAMVARYEE